MAVGKHLYNFGFISSNMEIGTYVDQQKSSSSCSTYRYGYPDIDRKVINVRSLQLSSKNPIVLDIRYRFTSTGDLSEFQSFRRVRSIKGVFLSETHEQRSNNVKYCV